MMLTSKAQNDLRMEVELPSGLERNHVSYPDSLFLQLKANFNMAMEQKDNLSAAKALREMGQVCYHLGHYPQSLDYFQQAVNYFRLTNSPQLLAETLGDMGLLYYYNRQPELARKQYNEALHLYIQQQHKPGMADIYGKIGHLHEKIQLYDSAFYYQHLALYSYNELKDARGVSKIYENIGSIYEDLARYDSAFAYFQKALYLNLQDRNEIAQIEIYNNLGDVLRKTGRYDDALVYTRKATFLAEKLNEQYQLASAYRDMAKTYNLIGRNDSAFYYLELSRKHLLAIYSEENSQQLALLQTIYDTEKKNVEIEKLKTTRRINYIITGAAVLVIVLLVLLGWTIISRQRMKIRSEQLLHEHNKQAYESQKAHMQTALLNQQLEEEKLVHALDMKGKELSTHMLHIIQKNQLLENLRSQLEAMVKDDKRDQKKQIKQLLNLVQQSFNHDEHWQDFRGIFEQVHQTFYTNLQQHCDNLTSNDLRLAALLKMNMSSNDIATLLGVSLDSLRVIRYRLRKKLNLEQGESLTAFIQSM
ncbi:tetratricopeptide repeat protein [Chitinophaga skermanii]|uniref:Tetratricopeptide repeat protein n=1 Tax=Chitinophaga skermanii TaxID=331697 RepID=A0A327R618_9BACT|nr:tetratricopeptide repeat protein [Chitinophaga skermanii]RAJ11134.1 tetratricopeptide repeat protein [Chitinophaga skermanii]